MPEFAVREFAESDRRAVIDLWERCGLTRPWNDPSLDIDRKVAVGDGMFLVAVADAQAGEPVVGSVMAGYDGHRGWINYLAADPGHAGHGVGPQLMTEAEHRLAALGCPKINLQIRRDNQEVVAFYERLGFEVDDVLSMGKRLTQDDR